MNRPRTPLGKVARSADAAARWPNIALGPFERKARWSMPVGPIAMMVALNRCCDP